MTDDSPGRLGTVVVVGSANIDLTLSVATLPRAGETVLARNLTRGSGGKGANQAAAAGRLGARVRLVAATGTDDGGVTVREAAQAAGVAVDHLELVEQFPTGLALITVDGSGENFIVVASGANAALSEEAALASLADVEPSDVVLVSLEIPAGPAGAALRTARERGAVAILNPSPVSADVVRLLPSVDILIMNEVEAERVGSDLDRELAVVITMGAGGARVRLADSDDWIQVGAPVVNVVDTTGCGDAFAGAVAAELAAGADVVKAVRLAVRYAALAATRPGAQGSYLDRAALNGLD